MMSGRLLRSCRPSSTVRAHLGFAPHQLSGVTQSYTDKRVFFVKAHSLPIVHSKMVWRVFATAPVSTTGPFSPSPPKKVELPDIKWTAAPLPEIKDVTEEPESLKHFTRSSNKNALTLIRGSVMTTANNGPVWKNSAVYNLDAIALSQTHHKSKTMHEYVELLGVKTLRVGFDLLSGYRGPGGAMTVQDWLNRCLLLETVAGVAYMVAGMVRHGWMHTLREETENERMLIFMNMKECGCLVRMSVLVAQGVFFPAFLLAYLVSPRTCHRFVSFLEEEAVKTYTCLLDDMEHGHLDEWCTMTAPLVSRSYYNLPDDAKVYDMIKCIRAEEANHHDVNHTFAGRRRALTCLLVNTKRLVTIHTCTHSELLSYCRYHICLPF